MKGKVDEVEWRFRMAANHSTFSKEPMMPSNQVTAHTKNGSELQIILRQLFDPMPSGWKAGLHWVVEAYEFGMEQTPVGLCWVTDTIENLPPERRHEAVFAPFVDTILVSDFWRRRGIAAALLDACRTRWPNLELSDIVDRENKAFVDAYLERAEQQDDAGRAFVARCRDQ